MEHISDLSHTLGFPRYDEQDNENSIFGINNKSYTRRWNKWKSVY